MADKLSTRDELVTNLQNPNFKSYVVLGQESDDAWSMGVAAESSLSGVNVYLIEPPLQADVKQIFGVPQGHVAIVFGHTDSVSRTLDGSQAVDFQTVVDAITNAS